MTQTETNSTDAKTLQTRRMAAAFIPLFLCYAAGAVLAFLASPSLCTESYYVSCPIPTLSVYGALSSLASYLKNAVWQLIAVFFSVFTFFPSFLTAFVALYRGACTGIALFFVSQGLVINTGSPKASVSLYFLASVLLLLFSAYSCTEGSTLARLRMRRDKRSTHALLFSHIRCFLIMSGGILAISLFAVLFC